MKALLTPHITEKSYAGISEEKGAASTYTFEINKDLSTADVKRLVEAEFKVTVEDVRIINLPGKTRRFKGVKGFVAGRKKALVRVKAGQKIAAFDLPDEKKEVKE